MKKRILATSLLAAAAATSLVAQPPAPTPPNHVLVMLTVKPGITREQIAPVMSDEVKATVRLYLDGKIENWYGRADGKGVVFILNCTTTAEAQAMMDSLPLGRDHLADYAFTPIGPLAPLRLLAGPSPSHP
jgi:hypothetical protein